MKYIDPDVPEPIRPYREPVHGGEYLIYRPSCYNRNSEWPLVVVCHDGYPDSANKQIRRWTRLAEEKGFLVLAPELTSAGRGIMRDAEKQLTRQRIDEERVLAAVQHVRAGHSISDDRIFLHGWSTGSPAALYIGLKHPDVFRAISLAQPAFREELMADAAANIDHWQPIWVATAGGEKLRGHQGRKCLKWLQGQVANWKDGYAGPSGSMAEERAVTFYEDVLRIEPWLHIRAYAPDPRDPLRVQFKLRCSFEPRTYAWGLGDGSESPVAEPTHVYGSAGVYRVEVVVSNAEAKTFHRAMDLQLPEGFLSFPPIEPPPTPQALVDE